MGQLATELLIKTIESKYPIYDHTAQEVDTELIVRASSGGK
jgi:LacI family transcriptional regulator